ncbi:MAG: protein-export chaperone SecB [Gammaproteobacteria bacterium]
MSEENQFTIQKIYLKDASFESPKSPRIFAEGEIQPQVSVQLNSNSQPIAEGVYEVVLEITATAKINESTAFLVEVKQAGVFNVAGFSEENLGGMLGVYCPESLFPYAREAISELVSKGGFPPLLLAPVNFNTLYTEQLQQQQAVASSDQGAAH